MLNSLCGNQSVEKILLFLFVHGQCYGTQLHRLLDSPLTPIQKALNRLEKGGIILSYYAGKTRLYQFNPSYPLLEELQELLKKAYTLLPAKDKLKYSSVRQQVDLGSMSFKQRKEILNSVWKRLSEVKELSFIATTQSKEQTGWNGKGKGEVLVTDEGKNVLVFQEKGGWQDRNGKTIDFTNIFRWTLNNEMGSIALEHLRRGVNHPVFLFHLAPSGTHSLSSIDSHLCGGDVYFGQVSLDRHHLRLNWRVIGPKKNEEIDYYYT